MNTVKRFQRKKEDFICDYCSTQVKGSGYTNHCPQCLCSKHVDIFPGDRLEDCGGLMPLTSVLKKGERYVLTHTCQSCGYSNKDYFRETTDNIDTLIQATSKHKES